AVLAFGGDAGRQVGDPHGRVGLVDVLAAGTARAVGVDAQLGWIELNGQGFVWLGHHGDGRSAGVNAALSFSHRYALHAVATRFEAQLAVGARADDVEYDFFVPADFSR